MFFLKGNNKHQTFAFGPFHFADNQSHIDMRVNLKEITSCGASAFGYHS